MQQLLPLHGRVTGSGSSLVSADLWVGIYDANSSGNKVYDSGTDYNGAIIKGVVDVLLGDKTNLDLNYGSYYYMDININGTDLDFNGNERKMFESNRGADLNATDLKSSNATARLTITGDGNTGIANTTPKNKLGIIGDLNVVTSATAAPSLFVSSTGDGNVSLGSTFNGGRLFVLGDLNVARSATATPSLYISNIDGNIAIAGYSATSTYRFDVTGFGRFTGDLNVGKKITTQDLNVIGTATIPVGALSGTNLDFNVSSAKKLTTQDLNVIGVTTISGTALVVTDMNTSNIGVRTSGGTILFNANSGAERLRITDDGNVGIAGTIVKNKFLLIGDLNVLTSATATPSLFINSTDGNIAIAGTSVTAGYRLDVTGYSRITGDENVGKKITTQDLNVIGTATIPVGALSGSNLDFNISSAKKLTTWDLNVARTATVTGDLNLSTFGKTIFVKDQNVGANENFGSACMGKGKLLSGGVTILTTCVTANSRIFLTRQDGGILLQDVNKVVSYGVGGRTASTSFDINSSWASDANSVAWWIIEPA